MSYAIDFGTSNTVVTRWNSATQQPETLALEGASLCQGISPPLIPSLLYIEDAVQEQFLIGQAVRDRGLDLATDSRFFRNFKRGIGANVQGFLPELDGQAIRFEQAGEWFLSQVIRGLQPTEPSLLDSLIFTVPVDSFESYRLWLGKVADRLAIQQVRLLDEPTAAALGYGLVDQEILLVIDFGGGTLDLSLVRLDAKVAEVVKQPTGFLLKWGNKSFAETSGQSPKIAQVLAKAGINLGGADVDNWLMNYFAETKGLAVSPITMRLAERLKIQLSLQSEAQEVYFDDRTLETIDLRLDRTEFERILQEQQFFAKLDGVMQQVMQQAQRQGIQASDVNAVLLVGGTTQIPAVQTWVQQYFAANQVRSDKPFEAVAQGALQIGLNDVEVKDFLYHSYGIRYWDRRLNQHNWHPLIKSGQRYPMEEPVELVLGASVEQQPQIELIIGELGQETAQTEVYFDGDRLVTRNVESGVLTVQALNDSDKGRGIAVLDPPGRPGEDRVKIMFTVDRNRFLCMSVEDLVTKRMLVEDKQVVQLS